jgi:hypothetical protein
VVIVWLALLACAPASRAQQLPEALARLNEEGRWVNGVTESWWLSEGIRREEGTAAAARWKEVGDELARAGASGWAGDYFRGGETHGVYMRWSPRGGFVIAHVNKCAALVTGLVHGRVEATPTLLRFFPELDKGGADPHGHGPRQQHAPRAVIRFVPVEWRGARFLIAEEEMGDFGDYVAGLGRHNGDAGNLFLDYDHFFRRAGAGRDGGGPPVVPPGYERFIKKPVEARVASVGRRVLKSDYNLRSGNVERWYERASLTHVVINAGTERGVKDGMVFRVARPDEGDTVVVLRAGRRTSEAVVVRDVDERGAETFHDEGPREGRRAKVARGWSLTTSFLD